MEVLSKEITSRFDIFDCEQRKEYQAFCSVEKSKLVPLLTYLRSSTGFKVLIMISTVDWIEDGKFQLTYLLNDPNTKTDIGIRTFIGRDGEEMESIHELWGHAATFQREIKEMYGINFPGSPGVDEPFLLEGWDDTPPMRREFDTKQYSEETFFPRPGRTTNDPAEYMKKKLYPDEK
ncbi:MAG: NADH-quinone oxidoreductase subunit C [Bacteroidota bacterium]